VRTESKSRDDLVTQCEFTEGVKRVLREETVAMYPRVGTAGVHYASVPCIRINCI
jgi:hypothetical protein